MAFSLRHAASPSLDARPPSDVNGFTNAAMACHGADGRLANLHGSPI